VTARILLALCTSGVMLVSAGERAPVASLNHFWAALDDETARAIVTSDYLKTFANIVVNTVTAGGNRDLPGRATAVLAAVGWDGVKIIEPVTPPLESIRRRPWR